MCCLSEIGEEKMRGKNRTKSIENSNIFGHVSSSSSFLCIFDLCVCVSPSEPESGN